MYALRIIGGVFTLAGSVLSLPHFQTVETKIDFEQYSNGSSSGLAARTSASVGLFGVSRPELADLCGPSTFVDFTPDFAANSEPNAVADHCLFIVQKMDAQPHWERITHYENPEGVDDWRRLHYDTCCAFKIRMWGGPQKDYFIGSTDIADLIRYSNRHFRYSQTGGDDGGWLTVGGFMDCHPPVGTDGETSNYQWLIGYNKDCNP